MSMRILITLVVFIALVASDGVFVQASTQSQTAQERAESLRAQLVEVETKQAELQARLQKLEESLKPENIEANLAGIGSTKPEDLREQRRRQLEIERNGVKTQLDLLANSRTRLETAIARADAEAYRQSAAPPAAPTVSSTGTESSAESTVAAPAPARPRRVRRKRSRRPKRVASSLVE